jgi:hypothetical protein
MNLPPPPRADHPRIVRRAATMAGPFLSPLPGDLLSEYMFGRRRQVRFLIMLIATYFSTKVSARAPSFLMVILV